jgi:hypothetical protein
VKNLAFIVEVFPRRQIGSSTIRRYRDFILRKIVKQDSPRLHLWPCTTTQKENDERAFHLRITIQRIPGRTVRQNGCHLLYIVQALAGTLNTVKHD